MAPYLPTPMDCRLPIITVLVAGYMSELATTLMLNAPGRALFNVMDVMLKNWVVKAVPEFEVWNVTLVDVGDVAALLV